VRELQITIDINLKINDVIKTYTPTFSRNTQENSETFEVSLPREPVFKKVVKLRFVVE